MDPTDETCRFSNQVQSIQKLLGEYAKDIEQVRGLYTKILSAGTADPQLELQLGELVSTMKMRTELIQEELKRFETELREEEKGQKIKDVTIPQSTTDWRHNYMSLLNGFKEATGEDKTAHIQFRNECILRLKQNTGEACSEDYAEEMIEEGHFSMFISTHPAAPDHHVKALVHAQSRHDEIIKLEKCIKQIHDFMATASTIVKYQGDNADGIEDDVLLASELCQDTERKVWRANGWRTEAMRKQHWLILFAVLVGAIVGVVIYLSFFGTEEFEELPHALPSV